MFPNLVYAYIWRRANNTLYCSWTTNITLRLSEHNSENDTGCAGSHGPSTLVYSESFENQRDAIDRVAEIKKLTRNEQEELIKSQSGGETLTIYDSENRPCGERPRKVVHAQGLFHHVCHLWLYGAWEGVLGIWLQQREHNRPLYPGFFDFTSTGHIDPGETPESATIREAMEEIGLEIQADSLKPISPCHQSYIRAGDGGFDDELVYPFLVRMDGLPQFSPGNEVAGMVFVSLTDFAQAHKVDAPLPALHPDGSEFFIPHDKLCCLLQREWENARPYLL